MVLLWLLKRKNATQPIFDELPPSIRLEETQPEQPPGIDSEVTQPEQPPAIDSEVTQPETEEENITKEELLGTEKVQHEIKPETKEVLLGELRITDTKHKITEDNIPAIQHAIEESQTVIEKTVSGTEEEFEAEETQQGIKEVLSETKKTLLAETGTEEKFESQGTRRGIEEAEEAPHKIEPTTEENLPGTEGTPLETEDSGQSWHGIVESLEKKEDLGTVEVPHEIEPKAEQTQNEMPTEGTPPGTEEEFDSEQSWHGIVKSLSETREERLRTVEVPHEIKPMAEGSQHGFEDAIEETLAEVTPQGTEKEFLSEQYWHGIAESFLEEQLRTEEAPCERTGEKLPGTDIQMELKRNKRHQARVKLTQSADEVTELMEFQGGLPADKITSSTVKTISA